MLVTYTKQKTKVTCISLQDLLQWICRHLSVFPTKAKKKHQTSARYSTSK